MGLKIWLMVGISLAGTGHAAIDCKAYARQLEHAAPQKMFEGAMYLERLYDLDIPEDCHAEAMPLLERAAKAQIPGALLQLGRIHSEKLEGDPRKGEMYLRQAAELGDGAAMTLLAAGYETGRYGEPDPEQAWTWYSRAAERGSKVAVGRISGIRHKVDVETRNYALQPDTATELAVAYLVESLKGKPSDTYRITANTINAGMGPGMGRVIRTPEEVLAKIASKRSGGLATGFTEGISPSLPPAKAEK